MTPVARNASGSRIERSTCDSAAKLTHGVRVVDERPDDRRIGDVAADEGEPGGHLGVVADRREVRLVAGVGQLVEDRDPRPVTAAQDVADVARADEAGAAGDEQTARRVVRGHLSRPPG